MRTHTGVAARMFAALADGGINIALINTSEVRINVATDHDRGQEALEYLRKSFDLPAGIADGGQAVSRQLFRDPDKLPIRPFPG